MTFVPCLVNDFLKFVEIPKTKINEEYILDENDEVFVDVKTVDDGVEMMIVPKFLFFHEDNCNKIWLRHDRFNESQYADKKEQF